MGAKKKKLETLPQKYKDLIPYYAYRIYWSDEDNAFVVSVEELPGCMTHGDTQSHALEMAHEAVELYLLSILDHNEEIPEPLSKIKASGEFLVRSYAELHKKLILKAHEEGYKTLNKFIVEKLEQVVG